MDLVGDPGTNWEAVRMANQKRKKMDLAVLIMGCFLGSLGLSLTKIPLRGNVKCNSEFSHQEVRKLGSQSTVHVLCRLDET